MRFLVVSLYTIAPLVFAGGACTPSPTGPADVSSVLPFDDAGALGAEMDARADASSDLRSQDRGQADAIAGSSNDLAGSSDRRMATEAISNTMPPGPEGRPAGTPRILVTSDIGGDDPDDFQSMVHLLVYADVFDIEGIVAGYPRGRRAAALEVIDAYAKGYAKLQARSSNFPTPEQLRALTKQGSTSAGGGSPTEGSRWIVQQAKAPDEKPLWILVWGSITDVAAAVREDPSIKSNIRVYSIGTWNTDQDPGSRNYLATNHKDLWWIENDTTCRGMYMGGDQSGDLGNVTFPAAHVAGHGALGDLYMQKKRDIKMGDTPSVLYVLNGDRDNPTAEHWGGQFVADTRQGAHFWTDKSDTTAARATVNKWRAAYLRDWQKRMEWLK